MFSCCILPVPVCLEVVLAVAGCSTVVSPHTFSVLATSGCLVRDGTRLLSAAVWSTQNHVQCTGKVLKIMTKKRWVRTKRKRKENQPIFIRPQTRVWGKVIFLHQFVILFTGGACVVAPGGMRGCSKGGCAWLLWGACVVAPGGHAWLLRGCAWFYLGGHVWFYSGGACVVLFRGHAWFFQFFRIQLRYGQ